MSALLPVVVVGTGFGWTVQVPSLRAAGFDVVALVGHNALRTAERAEAGGVARSFTDLAQAIEQTGAMAVAIATPPHTHCPLTMTAIERGCHVLCEKPFALNSTEARTMLSAAERAKVVHLVGHEFRWSVDRALIARAIAAGMIGEPKFATLVQYAPLAAGPAPRLPSWWFDKSSGGGWLGASGSHIVDQIRYWLGEFSSLSATLPMVSGRQSGAEDSYSVRFTLANGVEGVMQQTGGAWGEPMSMFRVAGTSGTIWSDGGTVWLADSSGRRELDVPADLALPPLPESLLQDANHRFTHLQISPYTRLCETFRAAIEGRRPPSPVAAPTFHDGVKCMTVLDAVRESAAQGGALMSVSDE